MNDAYHGDLRRFDKERVVLAWDALIQKQQAALETLGVPTMFATTSQADCQVSTYYNCNHYLRRIFAVTEAAKGSPSSRRTVG